MLVLWKQILRLALPSIATFSSMTLTGMLTLIIVGRLGPTAIAAVGISNILMYNTWALFAGIGEALNYLVSQNYGEKTMQEGNQRFQIALLLSIASSVIVFGVGVFLPHSILLWMGANKPLALAGAPYLAARFFAFCFTSLTNAFFAYMRAVGDTKTPMYISLTTSVLLVLFTYAFTYGAFGMPRFGLAGAGWSMVATEGLGCILSALVHYGWYHKRFQTRVWVAMRRAEVMLMTKETFKLSAMELAMSLGMVVFTASITPLGTVAVAANEIALNILSLGFMPANGFGMAATIAVGQDIGAGNPLNARRVGLHTVFLGLMFMALFSVYLLVFGLPVARIYSSDPAVYLLAVSLIHIASFIQLFDGGGIILAGGLRGAGDTTFLFRMSVLVNWVLFVPLTILLTRVWHFGQVGAWVSLCTLIVAIFIANGSRYLGMRWAMLVTRSASMSPSIAESAATETTI